MWEKLKPYRKTGVAVAGAVFTAVWSVYQVVFADGNMSGDDWGAIVIAAVTAVFVYRTENKPAGDVPPPTMERMPSL